MVLCLMVNSSQRFLTLVSLIEIKMDKKFVILDGYPQFVQEIQADKNLKIEKSAPVCQYLSI